MRQHTCVQGCGKTTIVEVLEAVFKHEGMRPASISIDDFYLRFEDQQALAQVDGLPIPPAHPQGCLTTLGCTAPPHHGNFRQIPPCNMPDLAPLRVAVLFQACYT